MCKPFTGYCKAEQLRDCRQVMEKPAARLRLASFGGAIGLLIGLALMLSAIPGQAYAQKRGARNIYRQMKMTTGYYEEYDVASRFYLHLRGGPALPPGLLTSSPRGQALRWRAFLADSHWGININRLQKCVDCHPQQARDVHTVRAKITCRQCHGDEPIAGIYHYYSKMNPTRRHAYICAKCHEGANNSYATYVVHGPNPTNMLTQETFPLLFWSFWIIVAIAVGTFVIFLPHTFLWGFRELFAKRKGQGEGMIRRFTPVQRLFHLLLMLLFITQAATGLSRMYIETKWGLFLASFFGGYYGALTVHKLVGVFFLVLFSVHVLYILVKVDWRRFPKSIFGPDSLLPRWADVSQVFQHLGWFLGRSKQPRFDRWGYWEKFDYWAVFWGMVIIGGTGLILYNSMVSSRYMPGWGLNVALWIHRIEAILAMAHVFIIHFFIGHLRRHNFPMDFAMFEGSVNLDAARHERPAWIARLEQSGKLDGTLVSKAKAGWHLLFYLFGYAALAFGVFLLIGGLVNSPYISW